MCKKLKKDCKESLIKRMMQCKNADIATTFFENNIQTKEIKISLVDYYQVFFGLNNNSLEDNNYVQESADTTKQILRQLLDLGYMELISDNESQKNILDICRYLLTSGYYCIAAEYFSSACGINEEFLNSCKNNENDIARYISKYRDKNVNLQFMFELFNN